METFWVQAAILRTFLDCQPPVEKVGLVVLPKTHRLGQRAVIDVEDLATEPVLLMQRDFGSRLRFDAVCELAQIRPHVLLESITAHTLTDLAATNYGLAIVPSTATVRNQRLRAVPLVYQGKSVGEWLAICWEPQQLMPAYVERFVDELVAHTKRDFPGRELLRRAPALHRPLGLKVTRQSNSVTRARAV